MKAAHKITITVKTSHLLVAGVFLLSTLMIASAAHLYTFDQPVDEPTVTTSARLGHSGAIGGDNVPIDTRRHDTIVFNAGRAYPLDRLTGDLLGIFGDMAVTTEDLFGYSVAIDDNNVLIGVHGDDTNAGNVGQPDLLQVTGDLLETLDDLAVTTSGRLDHPVAMGGINAFFGAYADDTSASGVGLAQLLTLESTSLASGGGVDVAPQLIPEPSSLIVLTFVGMGLMMRRRREQA